MKTAIGYLLLTICVSAASEVTGVNEGTNLRGSASVLGFQDYVNQVKTNTDDTPPTKTSQDLVEEERICVVGGTCESDEQCCSNRCFRTGRFGVGRCIAIPGHPGGVEDVQEYNEEKIDEYVKQVNPNEEGIENRIEKANPDKDNSLETVQDFVKEESTCRVRGNCDYDEQCCSKRCFRTGRFGFGSCI